MSEDGLSARAADTATESLPEARSEAEAPAGKPARGHVRQKGAAAARKRKANGHAAKSTQKSVAETAGPAVNDAEAGADNVVWKREAFPGLELVPVGARGLQLDLVACRRARQWANNPIGDPPDVIFTYRFERGEDGRMAPVRADAFPGGACPVVLSMTRDWGDRSDVHVDEYRIHWAGPGNHWYFRPQRISHKQLVGQIDWLARLNAGVKTGPEHSLVIKIIAAQIADKHSAPIIRLPAPGLNCEAGDWLYAFAYGDKRPGDKKNPARRLSAEFDEDQVVVRNAAGGPPVPLRNTTSARLALLADYLTAWNRNGGALATFCFAARSLCVSIAPLHVTLYLVGEGEEGKTVTARFVTQCISSMGTPEIRLAGGGGTINSPENVFRAHRDCLALFDDKQGSEAEATQTCVRLVSVVHEGGVIRQRQNRDKSADEGVHVECGVVITANNLKGLDKCRQRRMALLIFEKSETADIAELARKLLGEELAGEDFDYKFQAGLPAGSDAMSGVIGWILQQLQSATRRAIDAGMTADVAEQLARERFSGAIETRRRQTTGQLLAELRQARPGARFLQSVAEAFAEVWNGGILLDRAAGFTAPLGLDRALGELGPVTSRLRQNILELACRAADLINNRISVDANDLAEQFPQDFCRILTSGRWGLLNHDGGMPKLRNVPPEAMGWIRDADAEKLLRKDSRRPPPRPGDDSDAELIWRKPARVLGYCKGNEICLELNLFSSALAEARNSEIDYGQRDAVLRHLLAAGILVRGEGSHLPIKRRMNGQLRRFIVIRADCIWPPEAKAKTKQTADAASAQVIDLAAARPSASDNVPSEHAADTQTEHTDKPAGEPPAAVSAEAGKLDKQDFRFLTREPIATLPPRHEKPAGPAGSKSGNGAAPAEASVAWGLSPAALSASPGASGEAPAAAASGATLVEPARAAAAPAPRPTMAARPRREQSERIAVLDADKLCIDDETHSVPDALRAETADLGAVVRFMVEHRVTQPWLHHTYTDKAGILRQRGIDAVRKGMPHAFAENIDMPDGWLMLNPGVVKSFMQARRDNGGEIEIFMPALDPDSSFRTAADASVLMSAINTFKAETGFRYRVNDAAMCHIIIRKLHDRKKNAASLDLTASLAPVDFPEPMRENTNARDLVWARSLTDAEATDGQFIHGYDRNAQYLAAMSSLTLGFGKPSLIRAPAFDKARAGAWLARIELPQSWDKRLPDPFAGKSASGSNWVTTPLLDLAEELGCRITIERAWLFPETHRPLEPLYKLLRGARASLLDDDRPGPAIALETVKALYRAGTGNFGQLKASQSTEPIDLYRPDWRLFIIDTAKANLVRLMLKAGVFPIAVNVDEVYLVTEERDPLKAFPTLPLGAGLAHVKLKTMAMPRDRLPKPFLNGADAMSALGEFLSITRQYKPWQS